MVEIASRIRMVKLGEEAFSRVSERRMSEIVTKGNRLDQVKVQVQHTADIAGDPRNKLYMQNAPRNIVVLIEENTCVLSA